MVFEPHDRGGRCQFRLSMSRGGDNHRRQSAVERLRSERSDAGRLNAPIERGMKRAELFVMGAIARLVQIK